MALFSGHIVYCFHAALSSSPVIEVNEVTRNIPILNSKISGFVPFETSPQR